MRSVRLVALAAEEMSDAVTYYENQASGLGTDFLRKIESAMNGLAEHPERWPIIRFNIRRRLIQRFPY